MSQSSTSTGSSTPASTDAIADALNAAATAVGVLSTIYPPATVAAMLLGVAAKVEPAIAAWFGSGQTFTVDQLNTATLDMFRVQDQLSKDAEGA